jgi:hypothetical protein
MRFRPVIVAILAIAFISAAGYGAWSYVRARENQSCAACKRPVHKHSRTLAVADGKQSGYCCPACALSDRLQSGARVQVTALTDHTTGTRIPSERAWVVRGSDFNMCARAAADPRPDKHPMEAHYDRCSPGLVAFSSESAAAAFVRQHGGHVLRFATLTAAR